MRLIGRKSVAAALLCAALLCVAGYPAAGESHGQAEPLPQALRDHGLGCIPSRPGRHALASPPLQMAQLPPSVDLSEDLPPAGDQGMQNSCVGWAIAYGYKTFQEGRERVWDLGDPAHQFSPSYVYNQRITSDCHRDNGMSIPDGMNTLVQQGCAPLSVFPYSGGNPCVLPDESQRAAASQYKADSFGALFVGQGTASISELKAHLVAGDAFVLAFPAYADFFESTCEDLLIGEPEAGEMYSGGHAVLVVGYDDFIGGFRILNSYGRDWMCDGFAYLSYSFVQHYAWEAWTMEDVEGPAMPTPTASPVSPHTQTPIATSSATATATPSRTSTPVMASTPTSSPMPSATPIAPATLTITPEPVPSATPAPAPRRGQWCPGALMLPATMLGVRVLGQPSSRARRSSQRTRRSRDDG